MKKSILLLFLVSPLLVLAQSNQKKFTYTMKIETSNENLWNVLTDFANFNQWDTTVVDVRCEEELKKKGMCKAIVGNGEIFDVEITDFEINKSYTLRHKLSSGNMYIKRSLDSNDNVLTETVWYTGISKKTFEKYKGKDYQKVQEKRIQALKNYVEG